MKPITVKPATSRHAKAVIEFNRRLAYESEGRTLDSDRLTAGVEAVLKYPDKGQYFVAETGGIVIGQLLITYEWSDWRNGWFWWIQSVYVAEETRNKGVFRALFYHVQEQAKQRPDVCGLRLYVEKENHIAKSVYERFGLLSTPYEVRELDTTHEVLQQGGKT